MEKTVNSSSNQRVSIEEAGGLLLALCVFQASPKNISNQAKDIGYKFSIFNPEKKRKMIREYFSLHEVLVIEAAKLFHENSGRSGAIIGTYLRLARKAEELVKVPNLRVLTPERLKEYPPILRGRGISDLSATFIGHIFPGSTLLDSFSLLKPTLLIGIHIKCFLELAVKTLTDLDIYNSDDET